MKNILKILTVSILVLTLFGCSFIQSNEDKRPEWSQKKIPKKSLKAIKCVKYSENLSFDRAKAMFKCRRILNKKIKSKIKKLDNIYEYKVKSKLSTKNGSSNIKEYSNKHIIRPKKNVPTSVIPKGVKMQNINGEKHICVFAEFTLDYTLYLFDKLTEKRYPQLSFTEKIEFFEKLAPIKAKEIHVKQKLRNSHSWDPDFESYSPSKE